MITSCSPGWVKFCEHYYPELLPQPVLLQIPAADVRRDHQDLVRREDGHRPEGYRVSSASCPAPRRSSRSAGTIRTRPACPDVDIALTTRELARMIKRAGIDFDDLPDEEFDAPHGRVHRRGGHLRRHRRRYGSRPAHRGRHPRPASQPGEHGVSRRSAAPTASKRPSTTWPAWM